jgi:bifunctional non-homologous end joining protein LigD
VSRQRQGKKALFPGFIRPALADSLSRPPRGDGWIHEVKFDGYRVQVHVANDAVKVLTRPGYDWTSRFKKIADDAWRVRARSAIIDGEVIAPSSSGTSDFAVLQKEIRARRSDKLVMYAFDLLFLNGYDLREVPLLERKVLLRERIADTGILFSESFEAAGTELFKHACELGLEGIVSKRSASRYRSDRTNDWIKSTCRQRETLSIVGYALKNSRFDGLYLGRREGSELLYAGKVDHGFSDDQVEELRAKLRPIVQKSQAYTQRLPSPRPFR